MIKYFVVKTKVKIEGVKYDTYGITGNGVTINDISINKKVVKKIVDKINKIGDSDTGFLEIVFKSTLINL